MPPAPAVAAAAEAPVDAAALARLAFVDPRIGTRGEGHTYPGATVPFGMVQVSPDTARPHFNKGFRWCAGYSWDDPTIVGFSHTHFSGTGHSDLGDILIMPTSGPLELAPGAGDGTGPGYRSRYRHETEKVVPGYYAVDLDAHRIRAEVTATARGAMHRYTFPSDTPARVIVDLGHSIYDHERKVVWSELRVLDDHTVIGWHETSGWAPHRRVEFRMEFSRPFSAFGGKDRAPRPYRGFGPRGPEFTGNPHMFGQDLAAHFELGELGGTPLLVKVAISGVDDRGARENLARELPDWDFDAVVERARIAWARELGKVEVEGSLAEKRGFYTALYHTMLAPTLYMDVDGRHRGPDGRIHGSDHVHYDTFSLWDTFRALHPWLTITQPERVGDMVNSLLAFADESPRGLLPRWSFHGNETWCMIGYHAVSVLADAILKGIGGIDGARALRAARRAAEAGDVDGIGAYARLGYVPIDQEHEAASKTLEYAYDDWAIARLAEKLGAPEATTYDERARSFERIFDAKTRLMRARTAAGSFREPFDPDLARYGGDYTEGNAWQYTWFVPHDVARLVALMGGEAEFVKRLDHLFETRGGERQFEHVEDITGLIGQYAHGNEPSHHVPYLYVYAGQPWRTQERVHRIMTTLYRDTPDGLPGNDDCGQMSAWYLFSALGFYPVTPGSLEYVLGTPHLDRASIAVAGGRRFTMIAHGRGAGIYVQKATLDGRALERAFVRHDELMRGATLEVFLGPEPNRSWAVAPAARPYSRSAAVKP